MTISRRTLIIAAAILGLLVLMILASQVGGIAIRSDFTQATLTAVTAPSPAVRGVPVLVRWEGDMAASLDVLALFRDSSGDQVIGVGDITQGGVRVKLPCETPGATGTIVIIEKTTQRVLGQTKVTLLAPGADCALR